MPHTSTENGVSPSKFTILVVPFPDAVGHANACAGATRLLLTRGHRVVFFLSHAFGGQLAKQGFEEILYNLADQDELHAQESKAVASNPGGNIAEGLLKTGIFSKMDPLARLIKLVGRHQTVEKLEETMKFNQRLSAIIGQVQPDLFVVDDIRLMPSIAYSGRPWIKVNSVAPLIGQDHPDLPPPCLGLPYNDKSQYEHYRKIMATMDNGKLFNDQLEKHGHARYPNDSRMPPTQALNVYAYPDELNYPEIRAGDWFNLEMFNHVPVGSNKTLDELLPETFLNDTLNGNFSGKYVYLSLGSMGSIDVDFMKRLVRILSSTRHKYIVSKGPRHSEFELAANMWGDRFLPQMDLLPHMDLVITHGGNNTTTETFALGKPMIVFPLFGDQLDNAQRLQETGYGVRLDPYDFDDDQLVEAVDKLLKDNVLKEKLDKVAQRMQRVNHFEELAIKIEELLQKSVV